MLLRLFLLSILLFFYSDFVLGQEIKLPLQIQQKGDTAMQRGDFTGAAEAFEDCLRLLDPSVGQKKQFDWHNYIDLGLRLSSCYGILKEFEQAERVLSELLAKKPPEFFIPKIKLAQARLGTNKDSAEEAYAAVKKLHEQLPQEYWSYKEKSFFHALESTLNNTYDVLALQAKLLFITGLYEEAIPLYEEVIAAMARGCYPKAEHDDAIIAKKLRHQLAECRFLAARNSYSCHEKREGTESIDPVMLSTSAMIYKTKKEYEQALEMYGKGKNHLGKEELDSYSQALFERGFYYYQIGDEEKARLFFEKIPLAEKKLCLQASLYLAKIYLHAKAPGEAKKLLARNFSFMKGKNPLKNEFLYLQGLSAYALGSFQEAILYLESALTGKKNAWREDALYHLGWSYLQQGKKCREKPESSLYFFQQAENVFMQLLDTPLEEAASLSLEELFNSSKACFGEKSTKERLPWSRLDRLSLEAQIKILLLTAESEEAFSQKEEIYGLATSNKYKECGSYPQAWFCHGLNYLQEGLRCQDLGQEILKKAAHAFHTSFALAEERGKKPPVTSINHLEGLLKLLEKRDGSDELSLYLRGLLAAQLSSLSHLTSAEKSLKKVMKSYPQGAYRADALYALACLYYKVGNFAAGREFFTQLRIHYPSYPYLAEAYLKHFPFSLYLEGNSKALTHLREFPQNFPDSPLLVKVYFMLGKQGISTEESIAFFEKGLASFQKNAVNQNAFYKYQIHLALAERLLHFRGSQELEKCEKLLSECIEGVKDDAAYGLLFEEGMFLLTQCYLKRGKELSAQRVIDDLIAYCQKQGAKENRYLSLAWQEKGKSAMRCADFATALLCFEAAHDHGDRLLSEEQKNALKQLESDCLLLSGRQK